MRDIRNDEKGIAERIKRLRDGGSGEGYKRNGGSELIN